MSEATDVEGEAWQESVVNKRPLVSNFLIHNASQYAPHYNFIISDLHQCKCISNTIQMLQEERAEK